MKRRSGASTVSVASPFKIKIRVRGKIISLLLTPDQDDGGYVVTSSTLRDLNSQGDTIDEAIANGEEAAVALLTEPRPGRNG